MSRRRHHRRQRLRSHWIIQLVEPMGWTNVHLSTSLCISCYQFNYMRYRQSNETSLTLLQILFSSPPQLLLFQSVSGITTAAATANRIYFAFAFRFCWYCWGSIGDNTHSVFRVFRARCTARQRWILYCLLKTLLSLMQLAADFNGGKSKMPHWELGNAPLLLGGKSHRLSLRATSWSIIPCYTLHFCSATAATVQRQKTTTRADSHCRMHTTGRYYPPYTIVWKSISFTFKRTSAHLLRLYNFR